MIHGTWSPVTVGSHLRDGRWLSATSAAYGCTCRVQRSRSPMFQTSFTATSAGTCGGQDTKKTPRAEEAGRREEHPPCFLLSSDTCFLWCLQPKQPKLSPGWQLYCHFVGFLLTITTILIYPSLFFFPSSLANMKNWTEGNSDSGASFVTNEFLYELALLLNTVLVMCT